MLDDGTEALCTRAFEEGKVRRGRLPRESFGDGLDPAHLQSSRPPVARCIRGTFWLRPCDESQLLLNPKFAERRMCYSAAFCVTLTSFAPQFGLTERSSMPFNMLSARWSRSAIFGLNTPAVCGLHQGGMLIVNILQKAYPQTP